MSAPLSAYRNIFGEPGKGVHAHRVCGYASVDLLATAGIAAIGAIVAGGDNKIAAFLCIFIILMLVGILSHRIFGVNTALNVKIFGHID